jgi:predicted Fe-Mo cluster-binding NifX family protein
MVVAVAIGEDAMVSGGWGRARQVAIAEVDHSGTIASWTVEPVRWDEWHDQGSEGSHHARVARFLLEHRVQRVICGHMGPGMQHMLQKMGIDVITGAHGPAREAVVQHAQA